MREMKNAHRIIVGRLRDGWEDSIETYQRNRKELG
jgi:hypothetical protein